MNWFTTANTLASGILIIARPKLSGLGEHWGVKLPNGIVAHSTDDKGPHYVTYQDFAAGRPVKEIRTVPTSEHQATMQRIQQEISRPASYHLVENNCEIFANRVTGGVPKSPQVKEWAIAITLLAFVTLVAKAG